MSVRINLEIGHEASVRTKKTPEGFTHDWKVFVRGCDGADIQYYVEKVVFNLHETFPKPRRVVKEAPYAVSESGYAGFVLPIEIYLRNSDSPKKIQFNYDLHLQNAGPPIIKVQKERYIFNSPPDDFKQKLLKGGGTIVNSGSSDPVESKSSVDDKTQMTNKPKLSGCDALKKQKVKMEEQRVTNSFQELFGTPITTKVLQDNRSTSKDANKTANKTDKPSDKDRTKKHSPHKDKDRVKEKLKERSEKGKEDKKREKERSSKEKSGNKRERSPKRDSSSPKRPQSPITKVIKSEKDEKRGDSLGKDKERKVDEKKIKKEKREKDHKENKHKEKEKVNIELYKKEVKKEDLQRIEKKEKKEKEVKEVKEIIKEPEEKPKHKHKKRDKDRKEKKEEKHLNKPQEKPSQTYDLFNSPKQPSSSPIPEPKIKDKSQKPLNTLISELSPNTSTSSLSSHEPSPSMDPKSKQEPGKPKKKEKSKKSKDKKAEKEEKKRKRKSQTPQLEEPPLKMSKIEPSLSDGEKPDSKDKENRENPEDYIRILKDLQQKIMTLQDNAELQKVVQLIANTGRYEISARTFDFDLCLLERSTVRQLQDIFAGNS